MKQRKWMGVVLSVWMATLAVAAWANGPAAVRKQVEAGMRVTGMITIRPDGGVAAVDLDTPEKLPEGIAAFVGRHAAEWKFEPWLVGGTPVQVRTKMSVRLVGKSTGDAQMLVSIRGADFGDYEAMPDAEKITARRMQPPGYPLGAAQKGVQGIVYLVVKVERDGTVSDVVAEQVNLRFIASEMQMNQYRQQLARVATAAARRWTFNPPTQGKAAGQAQWVARIPVDFNFGAERRYGQWEAYVPGPRERVAWAHDDPAFSPDALPEGGIHLADGSGPKLLTPLDDGA